MTLDEDIEFWKARAYEAERRDSAVLYIGIMVGLKMARAQHHIGRKRSSGREDADG